MEENVFIIKVFKSRNMFHDSPILWDLGIRSDPQIPVLAQNITYCWHIVFGLHLLLLVWGLLENVMAPFCASRPGLELVGTMTEH